ncbi:MAG: hypothetical protein JWP91_3568 [Fibrobacteres bacterium]|nr:hypothetical protein [Fibrobacterota bacterium]
MQPTPKTPFDVFAFLDYRNLLRQWYAQKKAENPRFSYRLLARKVGYSSAGFFTLILQGKSNISLTMADRFAEAMKLKKKEREYLLALILFNQAKDAGEKERYQRKLESFTAFKVKHLGPERFRFLEKWYYIAVRELLTFMPFRGDFKALGAMLEPPISAEQAEEALSLLLELGMVIRTAQGGYARVDSVLSTGYQARAPEVEGFFKAMHQLGGEALTRFPREERNLSWLTLSTTRAKYKEIIEELRAFRLRILEMVENEPKEEMVYQFNFEIFPLSKPVGGKPK